MNDSAILNYGRGRVSLYKEEEYLDCLKRGFSSNTESFVYLDSNPRFQGFLSACAAWAVEKGYMEISHVAQGDQEQVTELRLTEAGKQLVR